MNSNTFGEDDIPEAIEDLAGSLDAPDPAAIHAGLGKRQAFRRRALGGAGAFVAILAIAGGALALTNDTTTTETAAEDAMGEVDGLIFEWEGSVADDSAPFEESPVTTVVFPMYFPEALVLIDECANGSTISLGSEQWLAWELPPEWQGRGTVEVTVEIDENTLVATDEDGLTAPFVRNDGQGQRSPCVGFTYQQPADDASVATTAVDPGITTTTRPPSTTTLADGLRVVPDLQGYEFNDALIILFEMEFRTIRIDETSSNIASGHVIRTEPNSGSSLEDDDIVTIIVSSGEPKSSVPNVEATLADSAAQQLRAEGFEVLIDFVAVDDPSLLNFVLSQSPPPNANRIPGSTVTIVVGVEAID